MSTRACVLALSLAASACVPWYRTDEVRALRADQGMTEVLEACKNKAGDEATECYREAVERNALDPEASLGLADSLVRTRRFAEARRVIHVAMEFLAKQGPPLRSARDRHLLVFLRSYADQGLPVLGLERAQALQESVHDTTLPLTLADANRYYPAELGGLFRADQLAQQGSHREALEEYASWLSDYGIPDRPFLRAWADVILTKCEPITAGLVRAGDAAATAGDWIGALTSYSAAYRYSPSTRGEVADKLAFASSHLTELSLLSPIARERFEEAQAAAAANEPGKALRAYRRALAAAPYWTEARHDLAIVLAHVEAYDEAQLQMDWCQALDVAGPLAEKAKKHRAEWPQAAPLHSVAP